MSCSRGMRKCRLDCLHRRDVQDYRAARTADEERMERETALYKGDVELWKQYNTMINFKDWLTGKKAWRDREDLAG
jgi:hypothetical protein